MQKQITITPASKATFNNNADYCVGTGRMGLAMQEEYQKQLELAQELAGFRYIRGHGLFCEDMSIYQSVPDGKGGWKFGGYCFTYLDRVVDSYLEKGIRPFLELGFMPGAIASGTRSCVRTVVMISSVPMDRGSFSSLYSPAMARPATGISHGRKAYSPRAWVAHSTAMANRPPTRPQSTPTTALAASQKTIVRR